MRFVVLGGTGFLGRSVCEQLLAEGHEVTAVGRHVRPRAQWPAVPQGSGGTYRQVALDIEGDDADAVELALARLFGPGEAGSGGDPEPGSGRDAEPGSGGDAEPGSGGDAEPGSGGGERPSGAAVDGIVMAFGVDDRERTPLPVPDYFERRLVEPTRRVARAAVAAGVPRMVVVGSYFSWFARMHPEWRLVERHPYIAAREAQAVQAARIGGDVTAVSVLEVPWVFGSVPGHTPQWKAMLFEPLRLSPVGFALPGGTAICSNRAIALAACNVLTGAAVQSRRGAGRYPVATANISHRDMTRVVLGVLGKDGRRVLQLGQGALQVGLMAERLRIALLRKGSGLDPRTYAQVQARDLSIDPSVTQAAFGVPPEPAEQLVADTVALCYP